ncbi:MAG: AIR synthase family protein [Dehalococcoidia bacterium]
MTDLKKLKAGKLPLDLLDSLLSGIEINDPRVVLGPKAGEDAALIDFGDRYLVTKTDPITFATDLIGWYVVQVNANDLAVMGATPKWLMVTMLLPEGTTTEEVSRIFEQLTEACKERDITLVGGHTEVTYGLSRPIAVGSMLGEVSKDKVVMTSGAKVGDSIILTKGAPIEGAAILAREASEELIAAGVSSEIIEKAKNFLFAPGISVARDAEIATSAAKVHAMHDPTEGGIVGALLEFATGAGVGLEIDAARIPTLPEAQTICDALGLDPLGLIASGALLATVAPEDAKKVIEALICEGIFAVEIGRLTTRDRGLKMRTPQGIIDLPRFERDELARFFGT